MIEIPIIEELVTSRRRLLAFTVYHHSLRYIGLDVKSLINEEQWDVPDQYVSAAILSYREIDNTDLRIIHLAKEKIQDWQMMKNQLNLIEHDFHFLFKRIVVLFNTSCPSEHGEARLFDYDWAIRNEICDLALDFKSTLSKNFFEILRRQFFDEFGMEEKYVLCMFSQYIPCSLPRHMCSRLLHEFASRQNEQLIVSYFDVPYLTCAHTAWNEMKKSKNVYCLHSKDVKFRRRKTFSFKGGLEEVIDITLYEEERLENYIQCARQVRYLQKRTNFRCRKWFRKEFLLNSQYYRN